MLETQVMIQVGKTVSLILALICYFAGKDYLRISTQ